MPARPDPTPALPVPPGPAADAPSQDGAARLRWPLPALATWLAAAAMAAAVAALGAPSPWPEAAGVALAGACALTQRDAWRRAIVAGGYPLALGLLSPSAGGALPAWAWLLPMALLMLAYPLRAWRDAPLFPTPAGALDALAAQAPLPDGARVLDAGCGLGHGLRALRRAYPRATLAGVEWSAPLALAARLACPWATVRRGDLWAGDWRELSLLYVFQRPESMPRVWAKACAELPAGAWLASLEFAVPGVAPHAVLDTAGGRRLWLYRLPAAPSSTDARGR